MAFPLAAALTLGGAGVNALGSIMSSGKMKKAAGVAENAAMQSAGLLSDAARQSSEFGYDRTLELADGLTTQHRDDLMEAYDEIFAQLDKTQGEVLGANENYLNRTLNALNTGTQQATGVLDKASANFQPYADAGTDALAQIRALMGLDGGEAQRAAFGQFETSPGYQFRFNEGQRAVDRSAAARGGTNSGATLKALTDYGQGRAAEEYGNYFSRLGGLSDQGFNALTAQGNIAGQQSNIFNNAGINRANAITGAGNTAVNALSKFGGARADALLGRGQGKMGIETNRINMLQNAIPIRMGGITDQANAEASGIMGAANARQQGLAAGAQGITGVTNSISNALGSLSGMNFGGGNALPQVGMGRLY